MVIRLSFQIIQIIVHCFFQGTEPGKPLVDNYPVFTDQNLKGNSGDGILLGNRILPSQQITAIYPR